ncbi:MAG: hypothetical protein HDS66_00270 [Bacteroidales bacterium]|nr:hypothetical protein [Bacteroidales bacterium]
MKRSLKLIATSLLLGSAASASAQYYDMANQLVSMVQPALSGGLNYRGFVDAGYTTGVGRNGVSSLEFSTTQGFKYGSWFFMGVGAGVNIMFAGQKDVDYANGINRPQWGNGYDPNYKTRDTGVMIPLYSDFRFNIGGEQNASVFIDLKVGAAFLVGKNYLLTPDGVLDNSEGFYFKPTLGVRIPVNSKDSRQAVNIGVSYQLITNDYWTYGGYYNNTTINSVGATIGYEW